MTLDCINLRSRTAIAACVLSLLLFPSAIASAGVLSEKIEVDTLSAHFSNSVANLMEGRMAGVLVRSADGSPSAFEEIVIRNGLSLRGDTMPLIILDGAWLNPAGDTVPNAMGMMVSGDYQSPQSILRGIETDEIESIEVLKNASATALYGGNGANGVVIIRSKAGTKNGVRLTWNSSLTVSPVSKDFNGIEGVKNAPVSHHHYLRFDGSEMGTDFSLGLYVRDDNGALPTGGNTDFGLRAALRKSIARKIDVGVHAYFSRFSSDIPYAVHFLGSSSMTGRLFALAQDPESDVAPTETVASWKKDYDDKVVGYRFAPNLYLDWTFAKYFHFKVNGGVDYLNRTRQRWMGKNLDASSPLGGVAGKALSMLVRINADAALSASIPFASKHLINATFRVDYDGNLLNGNSSCGSKFDTEILRANGIALASNYVRPSYESYYSSHIGYSAYVGYKFRECLSADFGLRSFRAIGFDEKCNYAPFVSARFDLARFINMAPVSTLELNVGWGKTYNDNMLPYSSSGIYLNNVMKSTVDNEKMLYYDLRLKDIYSEGTIGLKYGMFNDRLVVDAEYYSGETKECMTVKDKRLTISDKRALENITKLARHGVDLNLHGEPVKTRNVIWTVDANFSFGSLVLVDGGLDNTYLYHGNSVYADGSDAGKVTIFSKDYAPGVFYGLNKETQKLDVIGNPFPNTVYGINTTLSAFGFKLGLNFNGTVGNDVLNLNSVSLGDPITSDMVEDASHIRLSNLSIGYDFDMSKVKLIRSLSLTANMGNLFVASKYKGRDPLVNSFVNDWSLQGIDLGAYPRFRNFSFGICVKF